MVISSANMNLRKWETNSKELRGLWEENGFDVGNDANMLGSAKSPLKVLGLSWDTSSDSLKFELNSLLRFLINRSDTKRCVLQASARIFDPIGLLSPFTIRVKCLFQDIWEQGLCWDQELHGDLLRKWNRWCLELPQLQEVSVPRYYFRDSNSVAESQLHSFCDASERAYGAVIYIRYVTTDGKIGVSLVTSKARVAPLKKLTLPRLELMGALKGARLMNHVKDIFGLLSSKIRMWTDSTITLHWIRGSARLWKPFVCNRVTEVQSLTEPQSWSHCSGRDNPADLLSRGHHVGELLQDNLWWRGPSWLSQPEDQWRQSNPEFTDKSIQEIEQRNSPSTQMSCAVSKIQDLLSLEKFSSLRGVLRITAWILRFLNNVKKNTEKRSGSLTAEELLMAEYYWINRTQQVAFGPELNDLQVGRTVSRDSKIMSLNPFLDRNGLICIGGRLQQADFSFSEKHPWILPSKNKICELVVKDSHKRVLHSGMRDTLVQVRERYWIIRGRQLVKTLVQKCVLCKRFTARSGMQVTAPLPRERITEAPPFEVTGVDFAGPLYTRQGNKAYIALFTCAVTRAVHLELVSDLTTETFMLALRRFISRRGMCRVMYSDNAKTFKRANQDLKDLWAAINSPELKDFYGKQGISWKFIVERAAWWGGFWERLVRSVKTCLKKTLGKTSLTFEELQTKLSEVEAVLNSRPITFTYNDAGEPTPLTPAHFLTGGRLTTLPSHSQKTFELSSSKNQLIRKLKYQNELLNRIWTRWRKEYLLELKSAMSSVPPRAVKEVKVDDVVLVNEDKIPRHMWKIGRICEVFRGRDNKVRSCSLRLPSGTMLRRPIQLLYPLELSQCDELKPSFIGPEDVETPIAGNIPNV